MKFMKKYLQKKKIKKQLVENNKKIGGKKIMENNEKITVEHALKKQT